MKCPVCNSTRYKNGHCNKCGFYNNQLNKKEVKNDKKNNFKTFKKVCESCFKG